MAHHFNYYKISRRKNRWNNMFRYKDCRFNSEFSALIPIAIWSVAIILGLFCFFHYRTEHAQSLQCFTSRRLLAATPFLFINPDCSTTNTTTTSLAVVWETCDFENSTNLKGGWIALYIILTLIVFIALAVICDDFFVPSLEIISEKMHLSEDVAGATFMAAGSSSPELFSSIAAVTFDSDVGIGTITGSAVFNLLVIISLSAAVSKTTLTLDWRPVTRDSIFYFVSVCWLIAAVWNTFIEIYDAIIMILIYVTYITFMAFNPVIMKKCGSQNCCCFISKVEPMIEEEEIINQSQSILHDRRKSLLNVIGFSSEKRKSLQTHSLTVLQETDSETLEDDYKMPVINCCCKCCPPIRGAPPNRDEYQEELKNADEGRFTRSNIKFFYVAKWIIFVIAFPFLVMFSYTIMDCTKTKNKKYFLLSFFSSIFWLGSLTFAMVVMVSRFGCLLKVDPFVMSLVVLAAGSSLPDLLASLIVAREGYGNMAVSNAIGSNVFDINFGLGLPFFIRILINKGSAISLFSQTERKAYCNGTMRLMPHPKFAFILLFLLLLAYSLFLAVKFKLGKVLGFSFFTLYVMFLCYAFLQQFLCGTLYNC